MLSDATGVRDLDSSLQKKDEKIVSLEENIKIYEQSFNDEEFLFNNSAVFKRLKFNLWLHTKYNLLVESGSSDPNLTNVARFV